MGVNATQTITRQQVVEAVTAAYAARNRGLSKSHPSLSVIGPWSADVAEPWVLTGIGIGDPENSGTREPIHLPGNWETAQVEIKPGKAVLVVWGQDRFPLYTNDGAAEDRVDPRVIVFTQPPTDGQTRLAESIFEAGLAPFSPQDGKQEPRYTWPQLAP